MVIMAMVASVGNMRRLSGHYHGGAGHGMYIPIMPASSPVVLLANHYQFGPGETVVNGPVASCMQLWCRAGGGSVAWDGSGQRLEPGCALLLPWGHRIAYRADRRDPFLVSGVHVVPSARRG